MFRALPLLVISSERLTGSNWCVEQRLSLANDIVFCVFRSPQNKGASPTTLPQTMECHLQLFRHSTTVFGVKQCDGHNLLITLIAGLRSQHLTVTVADRDDSYDNFTHCRRHHSLCWINSLNKIPKWYGASRDFSVTADVLVYFYLQFALVHKSWDMEVAGLGLFHATVSHPGSQPAVPLRCLHNVQHNVVVASSSERKRRTHVDAVL